MLDGASSIQHRNDRPPAARDVAPLFRGWHTLPSNQKEPYRKITEGHIISPIAGDEGIGQWEYVYSAAANPTLKRRALESSGGFENYARSSIIPYMLGRIGYKNFGKALIPWIANGWPMAQTLQAYVRTGAHELLGLMQDGMAVTLGANQTGFCYTNGIGHGSSCPNHTSRRYQFGWD